MVADINLKIGLLLVIVFLWIPVLSFGQQLDLPTLLSQLQDSDSSIRENAFNQLKAANFPGGATTRGAVIQLLETETSYEAQEGPEDEQWADYFAEVVDTVAGFNDPKSIIVLIPLINRGSIVTDALAKFGKTSLDAVLNKCKDSDTTVTTGAAITIGAMLGSDNYAQITDAASANKIRVNLTALLTSSSPTTKSIASADLVKLGQIRPPGDVNGDGKVDCSDIAVVRIALGKRTGQVGFAANADVNVDGIVDVRDLAFVAQYLPAGTHCQ